MPEPDDDDRKSEAHTILAWVAAQHLQPGMPRDLALPQQWVHLSHDGVVHAARTADGRHCILLKKSIGWKENFTGLFGCDGQLHAAEIVEPPNAASYISLPGLGIFEELYISKRYSAQVLEVYFDLN